MSRRTFAVSQQQEPSRFCANETRHQWVLPLLVKLHSAPSVRAKDQAIRAKIDSETSSDRGRAMNPIETQAHIIQKGRGVAFTVLTRGIPVDCIVTREALERHFWLKPEDGEERMLKIFKDGQNRLCAIAERKLLSHGDLPLTLSAADFTQR